MTEERDPKVSRRYRDLGAEEPSRELDQAILSAAHRAADTPHAPLVTPAGRHRWYFAFGAAAILVLAVAVTVQVERQQPDPEALPSSPAAARSDRAEGFSYRQEEAKERKPAEVDKRVEQRKPLADANRARAPTAQPSREFAQEPAPAASAPTQPSAEAQTAPAAAPSAKADSTDSIGLRQRDLGEANQVAPKPAPSEARAPERREQASAAEAPSPAARSAASPSVMARVQASPEELLQRIAELRRDGRHDEADKALADFRQRYPDYRISEEMLQKVERKK